jgi:membrane protein
MQSKDQAASIAFFSFLSLFPLLLGLMAIAGAVLESTTLRDQILSWVQEFFPVGANLVTESIESLVSRRGAAGAVSVILLFWSGRKLVSAKTRGINRTLGLKRDHGAIWSPLRDFLLVILIAVLMLFSAAIAPLANLLDDMPFEVLQSNVLSVIADRFLGIAATAALIGVSYTLLPYRRPAWSRVWPGLLVATVLVELGKELFVLYVGQASSFDTVYGPISSIIALLLWLYYFSRVVLFGAAITYVLGDE